MAKNMVNLSTEEIQRYCSLYKLSSQESAPYTNPRVRYYYAEKEQLTLKKDANGHQAYSEGQINSLIFRTASKNVVAAVIQLHEQLILDLHPSFIFKIAIHSQNAKNLNAFISATQNLKNQGQTWQTLGISINDVVRILANHGGSNNLNAFITATQNLKNQGQTWQRLGLSINNVVRILAHHGGSNNLNAFITTTQNLLNQNQTWQTFGININDVVRMLANHGGSNNLKAFFTAIQNLKKHGQTWQTFGININDVIRMLSHVGGSNNLEAFLTATQNLLNQGQTWQTAFGITIAQVVNIVSRGGGSNNLKAFITTTQNLKNQGQTWQTTFGISIADVVHILSHNGGSRNLYAFITATQNLKKQGLTWYALDTTIYDVVRILANNGGYIKLQKKFQHSPVLFNLGASIKDANGLNEIETADNDSTFLGSLELFDDDLYPGIETSKNNDTILHPSNNTEDDTEFNELLNDLITDDSTPLIENSMFNNKRPRNSGESSNSSKVSRMRL